MAAPVLHGAGGTELAPSIGVWRIPTASARRMLQSLRRAGLVRRVQPERPLQRAYGRAQRTHAGFAERHGLPTRTFAPGAGGAPSRGVRGFVDDATAAVTEADARIAEMQDSLRPVEVGDAELRAGLSEVRRLIADVPARARAFVRVLGR